MNIIYHMCVLLICFSAYASSAFATNDNKAYEFGVLPFLAPERLEKMYQPVVLEISRILHRKVFLRTSTTSEKYFAKLQQGAFNLAIVNPFDSVPAQKQFGYVAIAARPMHHCSIFVSPSSTSKQLGDLKHKAIGVASRRSPITFYTKRLLNQHSLRIGIDVEVRLFPTNQACLHALVVREIDACGASTVTARVFRHKRGIELRELAQCEEFPGMVFLAHSRLPEAEITLLQQNILSWPNTKKGKMLLKSIGQHAPFGPYEATNFENIIQHFKEWKNIERTFP